MPNRLVWLPPGCPAGAFPDVEEALREPQGLLAAGADLDAERIVHAYTRGIFPWYETGQPILWWSPDPRAVLFPREVHVSRRLARRMRQGGFQLTYNGDFSAVLRACAAPRRYGSGTWITTEMMTAYQRLHELGWAHSIELYMDGELAGGLYGLAIGRVFFGESMFSRRTDASKIVLVQLTRELQRRDFVVLDCQMPSAHLQSMGARCIPRRAFTALLQRHSLPPERSRW